MSKGGRGDEPARDAEAGLGLELHSLRISASVRSSFVTDSSPNPVASDRASIRSTLLLTTPVSVTWPRSTMMWIGGLARAPYCQNAELP